MQCAWFCSCLSQQADLAWLRRRRRATCADADVRHWLTEQVFWRAEVGELARSDLALSKERARVSVGQPQRYGSQLTSAADGKLVPYPWESVEQVDAWRESMDLEPLAACLKRFAR
jgi:hypothetical protein